MSRDNGIGIVMRGDHPSFFRIERTVLIDILLSSTYHEIEAADTARMLRLIA